MQCYVVFVLVLRDYNYLEIIEPQVSLPVLPTARLSLRLLDYQRRCSIVLLVCTDITGCVVDTITPTAVANTFVLLTLTITSTPFRLTFPGYFGQVIVSGFGSKGTMFSDNYTWPPAYCTAPIVDDYIYVSGTGVESEFKCEPNRMRFADGLSQVCE